jgi:pimeloyl-ACP methyl ester carboxylesterase
MRRIAFVSTLLAAALAVAAGGAAAEVRTGPSGLAFYKPPHLTGKAHGGVIWARKLTKAADLEPASANVLVLYRSIGEDGKAIGVSGSIAIPRGKPPKGGWPVLTWAHGTTGIADRCAPTRLPNATTYTNADLGAWLKAGFAVVRTDYQGLGTPGTHLYLVGQEEGRSVLDIVRAARQLDPRIGKRVVIAGHSQGGHAALWAAALAKKWTPELSVQATAAFAPASHIETQARLLTQLQNKSPGITGLAALILRGIDAAHPSLNLASLLTPQAATLYAHTLTDCSLTQFVGNLVPADLFRQDADLSQAYTLLGQSDPEHLKIKTPLFIAQGAADTTVFPTFTDQLDQQLTASGSKIDYRHYTGVGHGGVVAAANKDALAFVRTHLKRG